MADTDDRWFESHDNRVLTAQHLVDHGASVSELMNFIEKPWHYEDAYKAAAQEADAEATRAVKAALGWNSEA